MKYKWPRSLTEAKDIQRELSEKVVLRPVGASPGHIAGIDAAFKDDKIVAAACLFEYPGIRLIERRYAVRPLRFPYVPGYLSFREGEAILAALNKLSISPDIIMIDGQGIAHPKKFGLASHIGVLLGIPSIGCAKSRLVGDHVEPGPAKGDSSELVYQGQTVGKVLRTRTNVRPMYISPGHFISVDDSVSLVLACATRYRLPEPTRCADRYAAEIKKEI